MKHLIKILFVLIIVSFLMVPFSVLDAADKEVKTEKAEKACCSKDKETNKEKIKVEYKGKTYYLCCEQCKAAFDKDPEKFLKEHKCGEEHEVVYVCPMKQCNVKTDKPGKCPKCGMELKKVMAHAHAADSEQKHDHEHEHKHE